MLLCANCAFSRLQCYTHRLELQARLTRPAKRQSNPVLTSKVGNLKRLLSFKKGGSLEFRDWQILGSFQRTCRGWFSSFARCGFQQNSPSDDLLEESGCSSAGFCPSLALLHINIARAPFSSTATFQQSDNVFSVGVAPNLINTDMNTLCVQLWRVSS